MSLTAATHVMHPEASAWTNGFGSLLIDASGEKAGAVVTVPEAGSITHVGIRTGAVTTPQTLRVSLQTVDAATGEPTGSMYGGSTAGTQAAPAANTAYRVALGTAATAAKGNRVAVVVEFDSTAGNLNIATVGQAYSFSYPYSLLFTTAWAKSSAWPCLYLDYSGVVYNCSTYPYSAVTAGTVANNSAPDEVALKFTLPVPARLCGVQHYGTPASATADYEYVLYDAASSALAVKAVDASITGTASATRVIREYFDTPYSLAAGTVYRLAVRPTTTAVVNYTQYDLPSAAAMDAIPGGQAMHYSQRTDAGAWADTTSRRLALALILDQFDSGAGGGGLVAPFHSPLIRGAQ